jgi:prepilin-type processing-associated H-X9-DG protein
VEGPGAVLSLYDLKSASTTITVFTVSDRKGVSTFDDHTHSRNWFKNSTNAWNRILADIQPDRFFGSPNGEHTTGSANYLYADGHVKTIPAQQIHTWAMEGFNFSLPTQ